MHIEFQSSPTPKGGRYLEGDPDDQGEFHSFNPRPPRKVGATKTLTCSEGQTVPQQWISILAHPERWALLYRENLPNFQAVNISIRRTSFSYGIILIHLFNHMLKPLVKSALFRVREPPGFLPVL